jgi:uncharacterized cupin superfamily protein
VAGFNFEHAELEDEPGAPDAFAPRGADIGSQIGADYLGGSLIEVPAGKTAWPYHWESAFEEWLIVLAGTPTVRTPEGEEVLAVGDVVCFPIGPDGAHQVRNATDEPIRLLMVSNRAPTNVIVYPDAGKVGVRTLWHSGNYLMDAGVDYWQGE